MAESAWSIAKLGQATSVKGSSRSLISKALLLKIKCIRKREVNRAMEFTEGSDGIVISSRKKTFHFGLCDGTGAIKATADDSVLEALGCTIDEGRCYVLSGYGVVPARTGCGAQIFLKSTCKVYERHVFFTQPCMEEKAVALVYPASPHKQIRALAVAPEGLVTVQGEVVTTSRPRLVTSKDGVVPVRDLLLKDKEDCEVNVTLWREIALEQLPERELLQMTHLRFTQSEAYGIKLHSTQYSGFEVVTPVADVVTVSLEGAYIHHDKVEWLTGTEDNLTSTCSLAEKLFPGVELCKICTLLPKEVKLLVCGSEVLDVVD